MGLGTSPVLQNRLVVDWQTDLPVNLDRVYLHYILGSTGDIGGQMKAVSMALERTLKKSRTQYEKLTLDGTRSTCRNY